MFDNKYFIILLLNPNISGCLQLNYRTVFLTTNLTYHHHISVMELGHLLTRSGLTYPEVCQTSFRETFHWLKFPLNGLRDQSRVCPVVRLLPLASGPAYLGMAFPPLLMKQLYRCDWVVISSFVRTVYHEKVRMTVG